MNNKKIEVFIEHEITGTVLIQLESYFHVLTIVADKDKICYPIREFSLFCKTLQNCLDEMEHRKSIGVPVDEDENYGMIEVRKHPYCNVGIIEIKQNDNYYCKACIGLKALRKLVKDSFKVLEECKENNEET